MANQRVPLSANNRSRWSLNGTQAVFDVPDGVAFISSPDGPATQLGNSVVVTIGRLTAGTSKDVHLVVSASSSKNHGRTLKATALVRSSTALPVQAERTKTGIKTQGSDRD